MGRITPPAEAPPVKSRLERRLRRAFDSWMKVLLPKSTEVEAILRLNRFVTLRDYFTNDEIGPIFIDKGMAQEFMKALIETDDLDTQICLLFTISDLIDIDNSEVLCQWFEEQGFVEFLLALLRSCDKFAYTSILQGTTGTSNISGQNPSLPAPTGKDTSRLKAACICALSSMTSFSYFKVVESIDRREIDLLNNILQLKSMMSLHSRCIIFINNLYVSDSFVDLISRQVIPSVMTLLMYNVTNHIKLIKKRIQDNLTRTQQETRDLKEERRNKRIASSNTSPQATDTTSTTNNTSQQTSSNPSSPTTSRSKDKKDEKAENISNPDSTDGSQSKSAPHMASVAISSSQTQSTSSNSSSSPQTSQQASEISDQKSSTSTTPTAPTTHDQVDKMYNDSLYVDFIASACILLGNLTTNYENCLVAESYSVIDIMTLLFHNSNDHNTPEVLANVVKCLANLATIPTNHPKLRKSNILTMAIRLLLAPHLRIDLRAHLVLLLANMAGSEGANALMVDRSVIQAVASFLSDISQVDPPENVFASVNYDTFGYSMFSDHRFQRFGCLLVANLATESASIPLMFETSIPRTIVSMCYNDQADLQRQAVRALYEFASFGYGALSSELEQLGAPEALQHVVNAELVRMVVANPPTSTASSAKTSGEDAKTGKESDLLPAPSEDAPASSDPSQTTNNPSSRQSGSHLTMELLAMGALMHIKSSTSANADTNASDAANPTQTGSKSSQTSNNPNETSTSGVSKPTHGGGTNTASTSASAKDSEALATSNAAIQQQVDQERSVGNDHFNAKRWNEAIACYSRAIELAPNNVTLFSNRSAAYTQLGQYHSALLDAERCITLQRGWVKGHFRRGKALLGLHSFEEAVISLKEALNCDTGSKEIQEALRSAVAKAKDADSAYINPDFCHLNASAIIQLLKQMFAKSQPSRVPIILINPQGRSPEKMVEIGVEHLTQLLVQLLELLKLWYDPTSTSALQGRLMGDTEPYEIGLELHTWASKVDMHQVMEAPGMDYLIFHMDMVAPCARQLAKQYPSDESRWYTNQDLSCYHFAFFVTTTLTRLVIEAHNHYAIGALKRIIQLNSERLVRLSLGTPLSQAAMQLTGVGSMGLPKMPWLRQLFLANGGVRCIAMDAFEGFSYEPKCLEFLRDITSQEWLSMAQDQLDSVMEWTVLPVFKALDPNPHLKTVVELWGNLFAIPGTRHNLPYYLESFDAPTFTAYILSQLPTAQIPHSPVEAGTAPIASPEARALAITWANTWLSLEDKKIAELLHSPSEQS